MLFIAALSAALLCAASDARPLLKTSDATSTTSSIATAVATWTPVAAKAAKAPNDLASFWVDYAMQVEALGYMIAANKKQDSAPSGAEESGDDEEASDGGESEDIDVEATVEAIMGPMREYQSAQNGGSATPADLKRTAKAMMALLATDASFESENLDEDAFDGTEVDPDVVSPESLAAAISARNALFARMPEEAASQARTAYAKMLASYSKALDMSVRSKYARVYASKAIDWEEYGRQYAAVAAKSVAKDPARLGPAAREYFAAWLHTGEPDKAAYDALIAGKTGVSRTNVFAAMTSLVPDATSSVRQSSKTSEAVATDAAFVERCRRAKAVVCDCNGAGALALAGTALAALLGAAAMLL